MDNQALRFSNNNDKSNSFLSQNFHGILLEKYNHLSLKKGDYIFSPEDKSNKIYLILKGRVKLGIYLDSGRKVTQYFLNQGDVMGELSLVGIDRHHHFASATNETTICIIPIKEARELIETNSNLSQFFMHKIAFKLIQKEKQLESLTFKNARTRIIEFIIDLANNTGIQVGYERMINNLMTHKEIGDLTATSRQTVTTILNELRSKNLLIFNRKRILIRDMDKLAAAI